MLSCTYNKGKCPGNEEGEMGDGTEQMRARYVAACAFCGFVMFRGKEKVITREESVCKYSLSLSLSFSFACAVALVTVSLKK